MLKASDEPDLNTAELIKLSESRSRMKQLSRRKSDMAISHLNKSA
jgi:hypothetical protein